MPIVPDPILDGPTNDQEVITSIADTARRYLRDFPRFFEASLSGNGLARTYGLTHPLIQDSTAEVMDLTANTTLVDGVDYAIDLRGGNITFAAPLASQHQVLIAGYYYSWFLDEDLEGAAQHIVNEHAFGRPLFSLLTLSSLELQVIAKGTLVEALWSLVSELAVDIDVHSPEGMNIPASERYHQVLELLQHWEAEYAHDAAMINVGLDRLAMYDLRRESLTTGRLVPLYVPREIDDTDPPVRVLPGIDTGLL